MKLSKISGILINPLSIIRNILAFLLGVVLFFIVTGKIGYGSILVPLGFVLAYNTVYILNDLHDYEEDKKDVYKWKVKPLLNGSLNKKQAVYLYFIYLIIGLSLSFYSGILFGFLVSLLIILNMINTFLFKKVYFLLLLNMAFIQMIKILIGWFWLSQSFGDMPLYFIIFWGFMYATCYLFYKKEKHLIEVNKKRRFKRTVFKNPINAFFSLMSFGSMIVSFFAYNFKLHILFMILIPFVFYYFTKLVKAKKSNLYMTYHILIIIVYVVLEISFFLISYIPALSQLNILLSQRINI